MKDKFTFELSKEQIEWIKFLCDFHLCESYNDVAMLRTKELIASLHLDNWKKLLEETPTQ